VKIQNPDQIKNIFQFYLHLPISYLIYKYDVLYNRYSPLEIRDNRMIIEIIFVQVILTRFSYLIVLKAIDDYWFYI